MIRLKALLTNVEGEVNKLKEKTSRLRGLLATVEGEVVK